MFSNRLNFHHCLGALDGKHIKKDEVSNRGGSLYYNYKGFHSVILVDADYKFMWVDVWSNGCAGDAQVFNCGQLREAIETESLNFPPPEPLPNDDKDMPYFIIGDDAFALKRWMMKPFSLKNMTRHQRIFNYRLSRARRNCGECIRDSRTSLPLPLDDDAAETEKCSDADVRGTTQFAPNEENEGGHS